MKVIPQTHHSHYISYLRFYFYFTMSVPDEGYSTNTSFALHYTSSFLFGRTFIRNAHSKIKIETKIYNVVRITCCGITFIWYAHSKIKIETKIINVVRMTCCGITIRYDSTTRYSHYIIYLRFYFYFTMSVPDEGYSKTMSFTLH
jgi:hypothetical protein